MKKTMILVIALTLLAGIASAQMRHQPPVNNPRSGLMPDGMGPMHLAVIDNGTVVVVDRDLSSANATLPSDTLVAYNASGVKAWSLKLDGVAMGLTAAANQFYLIVLKEDSRALVAVSPAGMVVWSIALN
jgi:hypothetical protein